MTANRGYHNAIFVLYIPYVDYIDSKMGFAMLVSEQVRAARHALRWTVQELAARSSVSLSTIKRVEAAEGVPTLSARNLALLQGAFEAAGIEFIGSPTDRPGIRIGTPSTP